MIKTFLSIALIFVALLAKAQLSGTYTIGGTGSNYSTINAAISALQTSGISGSVTFLINPGTYNEQLSMNNITGSSATNKVVFKSSSNDSTLVQISNPSNTSTTNNFTIKLNNVHFVSFQNLTIKRTGSNLYSNVIEMTGSSSDIMFSNCLIRNDITNDASYDNCLIKSENTNSNGTEFLKLRNNRFINGSTGILLQGKSSSTADLSDSISVKGNYFENQYREAVSLMYCRAPEISENSIKSVSPASTFRAIAMQYCMTGVRVLSNLIDIPNSTGIYVQISSGDGINTGLIANNMISISGSNSTGIWYENSGGHNIYFNSVNLIGSNSKCAYFSGSSTLNINLENNIFANSGGGQCVSVASTTTFPFDLIDYNDYYTTGLVLGTWKSTSCANISAWKNASGMDISSLSINPSFISNTNLHLINSSILARKGSLSLTSPFPQTDKDFQNRHTLKPDIGADEFSYDDISVTENSITNYVCQGQIIPLTCKIKNIGIAPIIGNVGISYKIDNNPTITEYQYFSNFAPGDSFSFTFANSVTHNIIGIHNLKIFPSWLNDVNKNNDTLFKQYEITQKITLNLGNDTNICAHKSIILDAGPGYNTYSWNTNATTQSITVDSSGIGMGGRFFRVSVTKNGCSAKDSILVIFVSCAGIEAETEPKIEIYPNPASNYISVINDFDNEILVELINKTGKIITTSFVTKSSNSIFIGNLPAELYYLRIHTKDSIIYKKLIVY